MKKNRFLWILMLAIVVPALVLSGCEKKKHHYDDDEDDDESTEQVESDDSDGKKQKKLIFGEYELEQESIVNFFGEDIVEDVKQEGGNLDLMSSFNFKDDDQLGLQIIYKLSMPIKEIRNTLNINVIFDASGTWNHNQEDKLLTVTIQDAKLNDMDIKFAKEDVYTKEVLKQLGGYEGLKNQMKSEMDIDTELAKVKKTQVFSVTRLQPDGFTIKPLDNEKRIKFQKVDVDYDE
ncbi:MAG: hypothetical protein J6X22_00755 [Muribaculaceae bacterium]|nr:hypothetical protein [Muribaculaceae bacterium]